VESKNSGERASGVRNYTRLCPGLFVRRHSGLRGATPIKRTKVLPKPWPPDHALREREELCAIHEANVTTALLFQSQTNEKRAAHACTRAALGTNRRSYGGVRGVRRLFMKQTRSGLTSSRSRSGKREFSCYIDAMLWRMRNSRGRLRNAPAGFILPCRPTVASRPPSGES
jgi:hypothetical protein